MTTEELIEALKRGDTVEGNIVVRLREQQAELDRLRAVLLDPPHAVLALVKDMAGNELCWDANDETLRRILRKCAEAAAVAADR